MVVVVVVAVVVVVGEGLVFQSKLDQDPEPAQGGCV